MKGDEEVAVVLTRNEAHVTAIVLAATFNLGVDWEDGTEHLRKAWKKLGHTDGGKLALDTYIHTTEAEANERVAAGFGRNVKQLRAVGE